MMLKMPNVDILSTSLLLAAASSVVVSLQGECNTVSKSAQTLSFEVWEAEADVQEPHKHSNL